MHYQMLSLFNLKIQSVLSLSNQVQNKFKSKVKIWIKLSKVFQKKFQNFKNTSVNLNQKFKIQIMSLEFQNKFRNKIYKN